MRRFLIFLVVFSLGACSIPQKPTEVSLVEPSTTPDGFEEIQQPTHTLEPSSTPSPTKPLPTPTKYPRPTNTVVPRPTRPLPPTLTPSSATIIDDRLPLQFAYALEINGEIDDIHILDWSPDGDSLLYANYFHGGNPNSRYRLFLYDFATQTSKLLQTDIYFSTHYFGQKWMNPRFVGDKILFAQQVDETQLQLAIVDTSGHVIRNLGIYPLGYFEYTYDQRVIIVELAEVEYTDKGIEVLKQGQVQVFDPDTGAVIHQLELPNLAQTYAPASISLSRYGLMAYAHYKHEHFVDQVEIIEFGATITQNYVDLDTLHEQLALHQSYIYQTESLPLPERDELEIWETAWQADKPELRLAIRTYFSGITGAIVYSAEVAKDGSFNELLFPNSNVQAIAPDETLIVDIWSNSRQNPNPVFRLGYHRRWNAKSPYVVPVRNYYPEPTDVLLKSNSTTIWSPDSQQVAVVIDLPQPTIGIFARQLEAAKAPAHLYAPASEIHMHKVPLNKTNPHPIDYYHVMRIYQESGRSYIDPDLVQQQVDPDLAVHRHQQFQWLDCCSALLAVVDPVSETQQFITVVDQQGSPLKELGFYPKGQVRLMDDGSVVILNQAGLLVEKNGVRSVHAIPDMLDEHQRYDADLSSQGAIAYVRDTHTLEVQSFDNQLYWSPQARSLFAKSQFRDPQRYTWYDAHAEYLTIANPTWSDDGSKLAFWLEDGRDHELWVVNADGSDAKAYFAERAYFGSINWAPDAQKLTYSRECGPLTLRYSRNNGCLYVYDLIQDTHILLSSGVSESYWSQDSSLITLRLITDHGAPEPSTIHLIDLQNP